MKNKNILEAQINKAIEINSQPYRIKNLPEIPNNGGLVEYSSVDKRVLPPIPGFLAKTQNSTKNEHVIVYRCHLERNSQYKFQLIKLVKEIAKLKKMTEFNFQVYQR